jgi:hypothetical protein
MSPKKLDTDIFEKMEPRGGGAGRKFCQKTAREQWLQQKRTLEKSNCQKLAQNEVDSKSTNTPRITEGQRVSKTGNFNQKRSRNKAQQRSATSKLLLKATELASDCRGKLREQLRLRSFLREQETREKANEGKHDNGVRASITWPCFAN